jgi:formate dehydrogenase maturation protein FdhE
MTPRLPGLPDNQWWCPRCKEVKPISDFNKAAGKERGLASRCKKCEREVYEERRAANPEHFRALACASGKRNRIRSLYGVTREEFDARVVEQDGRCAACGKQRKLVTDHDHAHTAPGTRDAVRGLICGKCNSALGFLDDDADLMLLLIKYVLNPPYPFR